MWEDSCPSALQLKKKRLLDLSWRTSFTCQQPRASDASLYGLSTRKSLELINYLPVKSTASCSAGVRDILPSEWRINSSFSLKSNEQFLKVQIYILWFWPFFPPLFLILGTPSLFYDPSNHPFSFKSFPETCFLWEACSYRWLDMAQIEFEFRTRVLFEQIGE